MPAAFITATGTDIGKTYVTAGLARHLLAAARKVSVLKPVASGFDPEAWRTSDPALLLAAAGVPPSFAAVETITPWRFAAPLSPDMAARLAGGAVDFAALLGFCGKAVAQAEDVLLIEGIGGLMVPLCAERTVLDLIEGLRLAPILVAGSYVGTLSHTLSALDVLDRRGLAPLAVVLNETKESAASLDATEASLRCFFKQGVIVKLHRGAEETNAAAFAELARLILAPPHGLR